MRSILLQLSLVSVLNACGANPDSDESSAGRGEPPIAGEVSLEVLNSFAGSDDGVFALSEITSCRKSPASGLFELAARSGKNSLLVRIKNFSADPGVYGCKQAQNNSQAVDQLGDLYVGCMVKAEVAADESQVNGYGMHRDQTTLSLFEYDGTCEVEVNELAAQVRGEVRCLGMPQTVYNGAPRNPVDPGRSADLVADFSCELE